MSNLAEQLKQGADQAWQSLADGWRELSSRASGALTRFLPSAHAKRSASADFSIGRWAFMAADVVEDDDKVVVRLEAPGLQRDDFALEVKGQVLTVSGEKRVDRESDQGRYRIVQCAYGSFRREVALPAAVLADKAAATYRDGVLRIELPKAERSRAHRIAVNAG